MDIQKVFNPASLAIFGVSEKKGNFGANAAAHAATNSNASRVYYVNPKRDEFNGKPCYHSAAELPEVVDCALICTPRNAVCGLLEEIGAAGIKGAVIYASGFAEEHSAQGAALEQTLLEIARRYDMAVIGPNCLGVINNITKKKMWGLHTTWGFDFSPHTGAGIVAQSGYITGDIMSSPALPVSYAVSSGNGSAITLEEILAFYAESDDVQVIVAYLEGVKNPRIFEQALRTAALRRKPVIILKSGRSQKGAEAAASHTGNLAGSAGCYDAIFRKYGVIQVDDTIELVACAQMFSTLKGNLPRVPGVASINLSGGENAICADLCEKLGIAHPNYTESTRTIIKELIPSYANSTNPLDATTGIFNDQAAVVSILRAIHDQPDLGLITVGINIELHPNSVHDMVVGALCKIADSFPGMLPTLVTPSPESTRYPPYLEQLQNAGIVVTPGGEKGYKVIKYLLDFASYNPQEHTLELAFPEPSTAGSRVTLSEADSKRVLADHGVAIPPFVSVPDVESLNAALATMTYPLVMKIDSADVPHKTEAGGVRLNIATKEAALQAFTEILDNCHAYAPTAILRGVLVQPMLPPGTELIIGVTCDRMFGPTVMVGLGGIFVELFRDVSLYPAPMNYAEARGMLERLKAFRLLSGYRGQAPRDIDALCALIVQVSDYAVANRNTLLELDINPVFVYEAGKGLGVVDALVVQRG